MRWLNRCSLSSSDGRGEQGGIFQLHCKTTRALLPEIALGTLSVSSVISCPEVLLHSGAVCVYGGHLPHCLREQSLWSWPWGSSLSLLHSPYITAALSRESIICYHITTKCSSLQDLWPYAHMVYALRSLETLLPNSSGRLNPPSWRLDQLTAQRLSYWDSLQKNC